MAATFGLLSTHPPTRCGLASFNSALAALNFRLRPSALRRLTSGLLAEQILHGSDLPVPVSGLLAWAGGMLPWREHRRTKTVANPLERDAQLKRALGFSEESFTRATRVLRLVTPPAAAVA